MQRTTSNNRPTLTRQACENSESSAPATPTKDFQVRLPSAATLSNSLPKTSGDYAIRKPSDLTKARAISTEVQIRPPSNRPASGSGSDIFQTRQPSSLSKTDPKPRTISSDRSPLPIEVVPPPHGTLRCSTRFLFLHIREFTTYQFRSNEPQNGWISMETIISRSFSTPSEISSTLIQSPDWWYPIPVGSFWYWYV